MRLNKFLALGTGISRRRADKLIIQKQVQINDQIAELGTDIDSEKDKITLNNQIVFLPEQKTVLAWYKPTNITTSRKGFNSRERTVYDLLPEKFKQLRYVGRLDKDTTGLLIFTNDGDLIERLTHPREEHEKEYLVNSAFPIQREQVQMLSGDVFLDGELIKIRKVILQSPKSICITITSGQKRVVRRLCSTAGIKIDLLKRIRIGNLKLMDLNLKEGKWEILNEKEIEKLLVKSSK